MMCRARTAALWLAALAAAPSTGCGFAVKHPAIATGIVGGTLGLATCKLASDNTGACFAVGGGAGAFLGLITAAALWLGGDGNTVAAEEQAQPLPQLEDTRPRRRRPRAPVDPAAADPAQPPAQLPAPPAPASPDAPAPTPAPVAPPPPPPTP
jgi:hypothetical protein